AAPFGLDLRILDHVGARPNTAHSNAADRARQLQRSYGRVALADGHGDGFPGVPLLPEVPHFPFARGYDAGSFVREVDSGLVPEPRHLPVLRDVVDTDLV